VLIDDVVGVLQVLVGRVEDDGDIRMALADFVAGPEAVVALHLHVEDDGAHLLGDGGDPFPGGGIEEDPVGRRQHGLEGFAHGGVVVDHHDERALLGAETRGSILREELIELVERHRLFPEGEGEAGSGNRAGAGEVLGRG
jgi:hypothetical protein